MNAKIELILLADKLDRVGLSSEANTVDVLIKQSTLEGSRRMEMHEGLRGVEEELDRMAEQAVENPDSDLNDHFREYFTEGFSTIRNAISDLRKALDLPEGPGDFAFIMGDPDEEGEMELEADPGGSGGPARPGPQGGHSQRGGPTFTQTLSNVGNVTIRDLLREQENEA